MLITRITLCGAFCAALVSCLCLIVLSIAAFSTWAIPTPDWPVIRAVVAIGFFIGAGAGLGSWIEDN